MRELFRSEIVEQRRRVSVLMARTDCTPPSPSSNRNPSSTSAVIVTNPVTASPTSLDLSNVAERMDELNRRYRRAYRSLIALFAVLAFGVAYVVTLKLFAVPAPGGAQVQSAARAASRPHLASTPEAMPAQAQPTPLTAAALIAARPGAPLPARGVLRRAAPVKTATPTTSPRVTASPASPAPPVNMRVGSGAAPASAPAPIAVGPAGGHAPLHPIDPRNPYGAQ